MKESYRKELAAHPDPESCGVVRKDNHEALTGADAGEVLSREIRKPVSPTLLSEAEGNMERGAIRQSRSGPARSKTLSMPGSLLHRSWEVSSVPEEGLSGGARRIGAIKSGRKMRWPYA